MKFDRRAWLRTAFGVVVGGAGVFAIFAPDNLRRDPTVRKKLGFGTQVSLAVQRLFMNRRSLAKEYLASDVAPSFRANGSRNPQDPDYVKHVSENFANWKLRIDGLVDNPLDLSLDDLRAASARTQITRHDCVEGWSAIGKWTGARLGPLLERARIKPKARFLVFYCADNGDDIATLPKYYESIDLVDAYHEQTILAYALNDEPLPVAHGAPIRLRAERQLGYKHAKYVMRIEAVDSFAHIGQGNGGFWEDIAGYEWYAGI